MFWFPTQLQVAMEMCMSNTNENRKRIKADICPLCKKPAAAAYTPFCSPGCKDRDLLQWLGEGYRFAGPPADPEEPEEPE